MANSPQQRQHATQPGFQWPRWMSKIPNCSSEDFGVPLGSIKGIKLRLHFTFFVVFLLVLILAIVAHKTSKYSWLIFLAYGPLLLLSVLTSELGRAWYAIRKAKGTVPKIVLWPLGSYAFTATDIMDKMDDVKVALFGVIMYIPIILFWFIIQASTGLSDFGDVAGDVQGLQDGDVKRFMAELSGEMIILNLTVFVLNLLVPSYPLACSRYVTAIWVNRGADTITVAVYTSIAAMILFIPILGVAIVYKGTAIGIFLMTMGFYVFTGGCQLCMQAKQGMHMQHPLFARPLYGGTPPQPEQARDVESPPPRRTKKSNKPKGPHKKAHKYDVDPEEGDWNKKSKKNKSDTTKK